MTERAPRPQLGHDLLERNRLRRSGRALFRKSSGRLAKRQLHEQRHDQSRQADCEERRTPAIDMRDLSTYYEAQGAAGVDAHRVDR